MIGELKVRRKFPCTIVIVVEPPQLVGIIAKGLEGIVIDERGRKWKKVPLSATRLPFLMLPESVPVQKCMAAVEKVLKLCAREEIPVRAVWLSQFGEAAIYLSEGLWLKLGNPTALQLKLQLGKLLHQNNLIPPKAVVDLSVPKVVSLWEMKHDSQQRR
jgi:cell division septal protein FtsQ